MPVERRADDARGDARGVGGRFDGMRGEEMAAEAAEVPWFDGRWGRWGDTEMAIRRSKSLLYWGEIRQRF